MRVALISDIHGNALALQAVLRELDAARVDAVLNLGDIFYGPLWPRHTWQLLRGRGALTLRGNQDRDLFQASPEAARTQATLRYGLHDLGDEPLQWLRELPATLELGAIHACHGTPDSDMIYLLEDIATGDAVLRRDAEITALIGRRDARVIVCGHTHTPRAITLADGRLVVNPGSVGLPAYDDTLPLPHRMQTGSPQARWALLHDTGGRWQAELRATDYDFDSAARQALANGRADWAAWLRTGLADRPAASH